MLLKGALKGAVYLSYFIWLSAYDYFDLCRFGESLPIEDTFHIPWVYEMCI